MKTAVLALVTAAFLSAPAFAEETAPAQTDQKADAIDLTKFPALSKLPDIGESSDSCTRRNYEIACDRQAYDAMRKNVSEWFADEILVDTPAPSDHVAEYTAPSPSDPHFSEEPSTAPM